MTIQQSGSSISSHNRLYFEQRDGKMSNLQNAPSQEVQAKIIEELIKIGWEESFIKSALRYIISGNDLKAIADYGEKPVNRFEKIVHVHRQRVSKRIIFQGHKGTIKEVEPLSTKEVIDLKKAEKYRPKEPFKWSIRWDNGSASFITPGLDEFKFLKPKQSKDTSQTKGA